MCALVRLASFSLRVWAAVGAAFCLRAAAFASEPAPSFLNDVVPLLTRLGCNQGACHGKGSGQNGFRLSLRGYAPEADHASLLSEFFSRRVNLSVPEESLFLKKATGRVPHEGGAMVKPESRESRTLLDWVRAGAPGPRKEDPELVGLDVSPVERARSRATRFRFGLRRAFPTARAAM